MRTRTVGLPAAAARATPLTGSAPLPHIDWFEMAQHLGVVCSGPGGEAMTVGSRIWTKWTFFSAGPHPLVRDTAVASVRAESRVQWIRPAKTRSSDLALGSPTESRKQGVDAFAERSMQRHVPCANLDACLGARMTARGWGDTLTTDFAHPFRIVYATKQCTPDRVGWPQDST
jgi:hypothetical protein